MIAKPTHPDSLVEKEGDNDVMHQEHKENVNLEIVQGSLALEIARRTNPPSPWSFQMRKLYLFLTVAYLCSALNGFDGSLMGALLPINQFRETFGSGLVGSKASLIQGMYTIGGVCALPFVGIVLDTWGRRCGMFVGSCAVILGTILGGTANHMDQLLASRFLLGWGYSLASSAAPAYVVEMSHPEYRDILTGLYNCQYFVGAIAAAGACRGCLRFESSLAWRIPIWCQLISSSIVVSTVWFIPESPRWLYSHGHREKAWDVIINYHGEGSRENAYVHLQVQEYEEAINLEGSDKKAWDFRGLVNSKAARWRLLCVGIASFMSQWAQAGVTTYYIGGLLATAGITDTTRVLDVNLGNTVLSAGLAYLGSYLGPMIRRRPMMIGASIACSVRKISRMTILLSMFYANVSNTKICFASLAATTGVYTKTLETGPATASIVFIFLIGACFSFGWTPLQAMYAVECLSYETRAKGMAMYSVFTNIALLVNQFGVGNAIDAIGWHTYIILAGWNIVQGVIIYFLAVETNNRTLEELSEIFDAPNPRKKSTEVQQVLIPETESQAVQVSSV
ncbi:Major facilitator superfamily domain general substrate transporter [Penicillium longicatenatum]|uniref:Major facilitator superfamily domain general substrate transporter n=1 Tax=Penicillium longicatenatum TaxID=1561947 RepID=UPI002547C143|nr:Major facilitator superfamily domain general substrate transporter [Penicillium longicatenatum]KAJ5630198.1 Major facilitator superfamily domain general substrate transporter [Penicillium longicatenatum]